jgi:chemotaxis signal transduction protein
LLPDWLPEPPPDGDLPLWLPADLPEPPSPPGADVVPDFGLPPAFPAPIPAVPELPKPQPQPSVPSAVRSFVRIIDDDQQESVSVPRIAAQQQVPIKFRGVGRSIGYGVVVRNSRERPIHAVVVEHQVPLGMRFLAAEPMPRRHGRRLIWNLATVTPGASHTIRLKVAPTPEASAAPPGKATFDISCIQDSGLVMTILGPRQMRLGEEAVFRLRVLNAGEQTATSPLVFCRLSSTVPGSKVEILEARLGPLLPGQSKVVNLNTQVRKPGVVQCLATVIAAGWPEVTTRLEVRVDFGAMLGRVGRGRAGDDESPGFPSLFGPGSTTGSRHLLFALADGEYAVPLTQVLQIERPPPWTPLPNVPAWMLGVAQVRGDIISLVDLRSFLGLTPTESPERARLMVVRSRGGELTTGLVVDRIFGMRSLECQPDEPTNEEPMARYAQGAAWAEGRSWTVLDLDRLLLSPTMRQFEAV